MSKKFPCECCGFLTYSYDPKGTFDICDICFWQQDDVQEEDPTYRGGANAECLEEAQERFKKQI